MKNTYPDQSPDSMETVAKAERKRRHRRRARLAFFRRLIIFLLVMLTGFLVWKNWDTVAPDKLLSRIRDSMNKQAGGFPVDISGTNTAILGKVQNHIYTLDDSHLIFYDTNGSEISRHPCAYAKALTEHSGKFILLAEQNGKRLQLFTPSAEVTTLTTDAPILSVSLNSKGQFAILTRGEQNYAVTVSVYNKRGEKMYSRSRNRLAADVALSDDGKQVALLGLEAKGGTLSSFTEIFPVSSSKDTLYAYEAADTLLYCLKYISGGRLAAVGDMGALLIDPSRNTQMAYAADGGRVLGYAVGDNSIALAVRPYGETEGGSIAVINQKGEERCTVPFTGEFRQLSADGQHYLLLTDTSAQVVSAAGAGKNVSVPGDGQQAVLCGDKAIVLGLNLIQEYIFS